MQDGLGREYGPCMTKRRKGAELERRVSRCRVAREDTLDFAAAKQQVHSRDGRTHGHADFYPDVVDPGSSAAAKIVRSGEPLL
jgi:hypothetical protein